MWLDRSGGAGDRWRSRRCAIGIRPQKIAVGTGDVQVQVISNQWLGDQSHVAGECGGNQLIAVTPSRVAARPGDVIPFALDPRHLHIFGADGVCIRHAEAARRWPMPHSRDVIIGIDAGTSLIKTVAFTRDGRAACRLLAAQ